MNIQAFIPHRYCKKYIFYVLLDSVLVEYLKLYYRYKYLIRWLRICLKIPRFIQLKFTFQAVAEIKVLRVMWGWLECQVETGKEDHRLVKHLISCITIKYMYNNIKYRCSRDTQGQPDLLEHQVYYLLVISIN